MKTPHKIYHMREAEIHQLEKDDVVVIRWNCGSTQKTVVIEGNTYSVTVPFRENKPYIDIVDIRHDDKSNEDYLSDDNPADGGFDAEWALELAKQLTAAAEYLRSLPTV